MERHIPNDTPLQKPKNSHYTQENEKRLITIISLLIKSVLPKKNRKVGRPKRRWKNKFSISEHLKGFAVVGKTGRNLRLNLNRNI
jgi:hypothetical protein